jgi:hypothetical protein
MTISTRLRAFRARSIVEPKTFFQALGRVRRAARDEIERLIAWLDSTIDVDEDEAADDGPCDDQELEPSLGSFDRMSDQIKAWQGGNYDVDAELDKCEEEPSLGSVGEMHVDQTGWAGGGSGDLEQDGGDSGIADQGWTSKSRFAIGKWWGWCDENRTMAPPAGPTAGINVAGWPGGRAGCPRMRPAADDHFPANGRVGARQGRADHDLGPRLPDLSS